MIVGVGGAAIAAQDAVAKYLRRLGQRPRATTAAIARPLRRRWHVDEVTTEPPATQVLRTGAAAGTAAVAGVVDSLSWHPDESPAARDRRLYESLLKAFGAIADANSKIGNLASSTAASDAEQRATIQTSTRKLQTAIDELHAGLRAREEHAVRVDARGLGPIALSIIMTGIPDDLARISWLGWVVVVGAPVVTVLIGLRVTSDLLPRKRRHRIPAAEGTAAPGSSPANS